jgi:hypothetical protein
VYFAARRILKTQDEPSFANGSPWASCRRDFRPAANRLTRHQRVKILLTEIASAWNINCLLRVSPDEAGLTSDPFHGDPGLFEVRPTMFSLNPPFAEIQENELHMIFHSDEALARHRRI